jgi:hypothetical protein
MLQVNGIIEALFDEHLSPIIEVQYAVKRFITLGTPLVKRTNEA